MHNLKFRKISVALCMALLPVSVFAAGLGKLNVDSGIGEPLRADIELISVSPEELATITAAIASEEAYATQGIERPASHNNIKVEIAKNAHGAPILKLKSYQPISEPFLDMLIQVDWNSGRLLREYTVLLDPPGYKGESDSATQELPVVKPEKISKSTNMMSAPEAAEGAKKNSRKSRVRVKPAADTEASTEASSATGEEYTTQRGDTLAKIAQNMKPEGISLDQMLVGLYEANKDAFSGNNMNRLKVGQIMRAPSADALSAISNKEASQEIKVQTENWNAYRNKLAGIVKDAAPADSEADAQSASGKIKSTAEDKSAATGAGPKDVVKLSSGDAKGESPEAKSLQAKVTALQEEVLAREKGLKDAQDRTALLEKQIADMQKLLALKSNAMTEMQKQAEAKPEESAKPEVTPVEAAKPVEVAPVEPSKPVEATTEEKTPAPAEKPVIKPTPAPVAAQEEPSFITSLLDGLDTTVLAGGGGLLAILGGAWFYLRNKRKKNLADFEQGIMTSGGLKANTVFGNTSGASVDTGDTSFLTDFSQSANGGMIDTNDVDPIAEAEVYMAYGRDAQAEEILKDAISKEPKRYELHLKLLEMYAASKNMSAFETVSGELYTTLGADDPVWAKVAEIGINLEPNNPLYQVNSSSKSSVDDKKLDASDFSDSPLAAEGDLDFSLDSDLAADSFEHTAPTGDDMDLNFGAEDLTGVMDLSAASDEVEKPSSAFEMSIDTSKASDSGLDFDLSSLNMSEPALEQAESGLDVPPGFTHTMPDLDFSKNEFAEIPEAKTVEIEETLPTFANTLQDEPEDKLELPEISEEIAEEVADQNNFGFDIQTISPEVSNDASDDGLGDAKTLNLSGISLNMDDSAEAAVEPSAEIEEPAEVETKLELVAAYIEMDDKEGAKELLDEVMREGGTGQRKRAEALLAQIA